MLKLTSFMAAAAAIILALAPVTSEAQIREKKFRLGFQTNLDNAQGIGATKFAEAVAQKSGGKMKVDIFPGGSLGGDLQTVSALRGGTVDATILATSTLVGLVKEFSLFDLPFTFQSHAEAMAVVDGAFGKRLNAALSDRGLVNLGYWGVGYRNLTNSRRPVATLEDVKGLKIRVLQNPLYVDLWNALGANAVPMPFPEVYSALEQKTVDGQENPAATLVSSKLGEVQKHYSMTRHIYFLATVLWSKPLWDQLNADERKVIQEAAAEMQVYMRREVPADDDKLNEQVRKMLQTSDISAAELEKFRAAAKPVVDKYAGAADPAAAKELFDAIAKVRSGQ
jgi:TRAP-type transport system periplasmic protein